MKASSMPAQTLRRIILTASIAIPALIVAGLCANVVLAACGVFAWTSDYEGVPPCPTGLVCRGWPSCFTLAASPLSPVMSENESQSVVITVTELPETMYSSVTSYCHAYPKAEWILQVDAGGVSVSPNQPQDLSHLLAGDSATFKYVITSKQVGTTTYDLPRLTMSLCGISVLSAYSALPRSSLCLSALLALSLSLYP